MKLRQMSLAHAMIGVAVVALCVWAFVEYRRDGHYYARGWWEAECELWRGDATIYEACGPCRSLPPNCHVDEDTGLPIRQIDLGRVSAGDDERVQGHNDRIAQYIRRHGLPTNTFKPWKHVLYDLKRWFDERSQTVPPQRLIADAPARVSPDGRNRIRPLSTKNDDDTPSDWLKIEIAAGNVVLDDPHVLFSNGDSDLMWGPDGSGLVVIRSVDNRLQTFAAYDLRTGGFLAREHFIQRGGDCIRIFDPFDPDLP